MQNRRWGMRVLLVLALPLVVLIVVPLALATALGFYALALAKGLWLAACGVLGTDVTAGDQPHTRRPHFLSVPTVKNHLD